MIVLFTNLGLHGPYTGQMEAVLHQMSPFEGRSRIDRNPVAGSLQQLAQHLAAVGPGRLAMIAGDEVHASGLERKIGLGQQPIYPSAADRKPVPLPSKDHQQPVAASDTAGLCDPEEKSGLRQQAAHCGPSQPIRARQPGIRTRGLVVWGGELLFEEARAVQARLCCDPGHLNLPLSRDHGAADCCPVANVEKRL